MTSSNPSSTPAAAGAKTTELVVWNPVLKDSVGFNGEVVAWSQSFELYNLGYGQRVFSPRMRMFCQMDSLSPFGAGGTNGYQFGQNNPIVYIDPTGHLTWQAGLAIALAIFAFLLSFFTFGAAGAGAAIIAVTAGIGALLAGTSASLGIGAAVEREQGHIELANRLDQASLVTGLASTATGYGFLDALVLGAGAGTQVQPSAPSAAATGGVSIARVDSNNMKQVGGLSVATFSARPSGSVRPAAAAAAQSETSSSLGRLLDIVTLSGLPDSESAAADLLHVPTGNPDRYATANRPPLSPYIRSTEQP